MREYCINELGNWNSALKDKFWQSGDYKVCLGLGVQWSGMLGEPFFCNFLFSDIQEQINGIRFQVRQNGFQTQNKKIVIFPLTKKLKLTRQETAFYRYQLQLGDWLGILSEQKWDFCTKDVVYWTQFHANGLNPLSMLKTVAD